jgi:hypothetical protein
LWGTPVLSAPRVDVCYDSLGVASRRGSPGRLATPSEP